MQIRDGLHIFGESAGRASSDRSAGRAGAPAARRRQGRQRLADARAGGRSRALEGFRSAGLRATWRRLDGCRAGGAGRAHGAMAHQGDTVERLELLAQALVAGAARCRSWTARAAVLDAIEQTSLRPPRRACGAAEIAGVLAGLDGRFVAPGPSGAPTRGRPDVLPTGRNFYSVDTRTVPTPAAWTLGWKSATLLIERYRQEHGRLAARLALSAWGTANMRTGGDDIAQALALMGVRPTWDDGLAPGDRLRDPAARCSTGRGSTSRCASPASSAMPFRRRSTCSTARCARSPRWTSRRTKIRWPRASRKDAARSSPRASMQDGRRRRPATGSSAPSPAPTAPACRR